MNVLDTFVDSVFQIIMIVILNSHDKHLVISM